MRKAASGADFLLASGLLPLIGVQNGGRATMVSVVLTTCRPDQDGITVASAIEIDLDDPRARAGFADCIARQARDGALRLREELLAERGESVPDFVPLAAVLEAAAGRHPAETLAARRR